MAAHCGTAVPCQTPARPDRCDLADLGCSVVVPSHCAAVSPGQRHGQPGQGHPALGQGEGPVHFGPLSAEHSSGAPADPHCSAPDGPTDGKLDGCSKPPELLGTLCCNFCCTSRAVTEVLARRGHQGPQGVPRGWLSVGAMLLELALYPVRVGATVALLPASIQLEDGCQAAPGLRATLQLWQALLARLPASVQPGYVLVVPRARASLEQGCFRHALVYNVLEAGACVLRLQPASALLQAAAQDALDAAAGAWPLWAWRRPCARCPLLHPCAGLLYRQPEGLTQDASLMALSPAAYRLKHLYNPAVRPMSEDQLSLALSEPPQMAPLACRGSLGRCQSTCCTSSTPTQGAASPTCCQ